MYEDQYYRSVIRGAYSFNATSHVQPTSRRVSSNLSQALAPLKGVDDHRPKRHDHAHDCHDQHDQ